ncbi:MAG: hypothetical protein AAFQ42_07905 [Pseudomonadota bacterium]
MAKPRVLSPPPALASTADGPNVLFLLGLLVLAYGLSLLAYGMTRLAHEAPSDYARHVRTTAARSSTVMFAMPLLLGGLAFQAAGEFYTAVPLGVVALMLLGLLGYLLVYLSFGELVADNIAAAQIRNEPQSAPHLSVVTPVRPIAASATEPRAVIAS